MSVVGSRIGFSPLFGNYFLELQRFLASFKTYKKAGDGFSEIQPIVIMGSPQAAYRRIFPAASGVNPNNPKTFNDQVNLPVINFIAQDFRRIFGQENAYARASHGKINDKETTVFFSPQQWEITYQMSVWTESYRQRDDLLSRIFSAFRGGEIGLKYYPDRAKEEFIFFEFRVDEQLTDETNLEELNEKESRKFVRSGLTLRGKAQLHYELEVVPLIKSIEILNDQYKSKGEVTRFDASEDENGELVVTLNPNSLVEN